MDDIVGSDTGLIHLIASILALVFGTFVLAYKKGNRYHKMAGHLYVISMLVLLITSFMLYRLFDGFGIFHYAAILSLGLLAMGIIPVLTKRPKSKWLLQHLSFMYWSVIGLYAAFASEVLTRIPETPFFGMVGLATVVIMGIGGLVFIRKRSKWQGIR